MLKLVIYEVKDLLLLHLVNPHHLLIPLLFPLPLLGLLLLLVLQHPVVQGEHLATSNLDNSDQKYVSMIFKKLFLFSK